MTLEELKKLFNTGQSNTIVINQLTINDYSTHVAIDALKMPTAPAFEKLLYPWSDWDRANRDYADACRRATWANDHDDHGFLS